MWASTSDKIIDEGNDAFNNCFSETDAGSYVPRICAIFVDRELMMVDAFTSILG